MKIESKIAKQVETRVHKCKMINLCADSVSTIAKSLTGSINISSLTGILKRFLLIEVVRYNTIDFVT